MDTQRRQLQNCILCILCWLRGHNFCLVSLNLFQGGDMWFPGPKGWQGEVSLRITVMPIVEDAAGTNLPPSDECQRKFGTSLKLKCLFCPFTLALFSFNLVLIFGLHIKVNNPVLQYLRVFIQQNYSSSDFIFFFPLSTWNQEMKLNWKWNNSLASLLERQSCFLSSSWCCWCVELGQWLGWAGTCPQEFSHFIPGLTFVARARQTSMQFEHWSTLWHRQMGSLKEYFIWQKIFVLE